MCNFSKSYKFPQPKGRKKKKQTEFHSGTGQLGKENVLENVALLFLFIAQSPGAERVFPRGFPCWKIYLFLAIFVAALAHTMFRVSLEC